MHAERLSNLRSLHRTCWRVVETQYIASTKKITDTDAEQAIIEDLVEETKPKLPADCEHLHFLLSTPFRYRPYPNDSRFRRAGSLEGVFYAAEHVETAIAEVAFYRLRFFIESPGTPWPRNPGEYTAFSAELKSKNGLDLTRPPYHEHRQLWTHPTDYSACLNIADAAKAKGIKVIRYQSVRDPEGRTNLAILSCLIFERKEPARQTWHIHLSNSGARTYCEQPKMQIAFDRAAFANDPRIAAFDWKR
jgi:hypothetical protein